MAEGSFAVVSGGGTGMAAPSRRRSRATAPTCWCWGGGRRCWRQWRPGGRIVNIASIAALRAGGGSYGAAKGALIPWTFHLAAELGPAGITANVVAPGYIEGTEFFGDSMTEQRRAHPHRASR